MNAPAQAISPSTSPATRAPAAGRLGSERGAALLAALCFTLVLALALTSYLNLCNRSLQMSSRLVNGSHSVELAETGMEEALWALHNNDWTGWTISGKTATKTLSSGAYGFSYEGGATGSVNLTIANYDGTTGTRTLTATGITQQSDGTSISRTLSSTATQAGLFVNAVAGTTGKVKFKSAGTVDSYDSSTDINAASPGYSAILASGSTSTSSATVQLTNAQVKGYVTTLSTGSSYSSSAKLIGNAAIPANHPVTNSYIDLDRQSTSPYLPLFDDVEPSAPNLLPSGTATIGTAGATTPTYYYSNGVSLTGSQVLTVDGPVVLVITGDFYINYPNVGGATPKILITANGSLEVHFSGDLAIDGNGIQNSTKLPKNLSIFAKADNVYDTLEMGTNTAFYGVIYTPNNSLTVSNSQTIYGAIVAKSVTFTLSPVIHYDMSLRTTVFTGVDTPYAVANLRETSP